jgi:hypothetical protein
VTLAKDTKATAIKISRLEDYIQAFDSVLARIQKVMPDDLKVYRRIVEARDRKKKQQQAYDEETDETLLEDSKEDEF